MDKVLITGASGFIGAHLAQANLARGRLVRALVLPGDAAGPGLAGRGVEVIAGDIRDGEAVRKAAAGVDLIFHAAALVSDWGPPELFQGVTVRGAENICRAALAAGVRRLVHISTNDVFGRDESVTFDESFPLASWGEPYPDAKIAAEKICWKYCRDQGLPVAMVYPCWVYGEGDQTFVPLLADAILKREMVFWRRDVLVWPTYIENLVDLMMLIADDDRAAGQGFLVHDGRSVTLREFCDGVAAAVGAAPARLRLPYPAALAAALVMEKVWKLLRIQQRPLLTTYTVKNLGSRLKFSIAKAERVLGWKPPVDYPTGFSRTMAWLQGLDPGRLKNK
ncbi:MAG: NAD-dependent epimerase/dehydratase family protein [Pseudomonadota bacterium]